MKKEIIDDLLTKLCNVVQILNENKKSIKNHN